MVFADMLTQLFEEVAAVLDEYYSVVHSCYGNSYMLHFLQQLQVTVGVIVHCSGCTPLIVRTAFFKSLPQ